jgi:hypothetical protein
LHEHSSDLSRSLSAGRKRQASANPWMANASGFSLASGGTFSL